MSSKPANSNLAAAKSAKKDEFYTQFADIEAELKNYSNHFKGKVVYLNCDDPRVSNFFRYFSLNFEKFGLKEIIATCYKSSDTESFSKSKSSSSVLLRYKGAMSAVSNHADEIQVSALEGDGDFRSSESIELLKQADIVVTNPPFSLFREFVSQLMEFDKKFVILGNMNALTYKEIFPLFESNKVWYGASIRSGDREFEVPDDYPLEASGFRVDESGKKFIRVKGVRWFTNLEYPGRHKDLILTKPYSPEEFPKYVNFDAIEVGKTSEIPFDYSGLMGVPISFIDKYNPDQFEIVGSSKNLSRPMSEIAQKGTYQQGGPRFYLPNGSGYRRMYDRIVVRNKRLSASDGLGG